MLPVRPRHRHVHASLVIRMTSLYFYVGPDARPVNTEPPPSHPRHTSTHDHHPRATSDRRHAPPERAPEASIAHPPRPHRAHDGVDSRRLALNKPRGVATTLRPAHARDGGRDTRCAARGAHATARDGIGARRARRGRDRGMRDGGARVGGPGAGTRECRSRARRRDSDVCEAMSSNAMWTDVEPMRFFVICRWCLSMGTRT